MKKKKKRSNDTEKCEEDQRGKENSPSRRSFYGRQLKEEDEG